LRASRRPPRHVARGNLPARPGSARRPLVIGPGLASD